MEVSASLCHSFFLMRLDKTLTPQKIIKEIYDKAGKKIRLTGLNVITVKVRLLSHLRNHGISVVFADTHRAGAIEQLQQHGKRLGGTDTYIHVFSNNF